MSLSTALSNSYSGLVASQRMLEVTSNNIANATTEGYARQEVLLEAKVLAGVGVGVSVEGVASAKAPMLTTERRDAASDLAQQQYTTDNLAAIQRIVGDSDAAGSLFEYYQALEDSLGALANDPSASHLQLDVLAKAENLAYAFNGAEESIQTKRAEVDGEINAAVKDINNLLFEIEKLNKEAMSQQAYGADNTALSATRDALIDQLNEYVPVKTIMKDSGAVQVLTQTNYPLVSDKAAVLDFSKANIISADMDLVAGAPGGLSGITIDGIDITPPNSTLNVLSGGKLTAMFQARDQDYVTAQKQLDALATDLIERFADPAVEPTAGAGNPGIFTDAGSTASATLGVAGRLEINALIDPDQGGELYRLRDGVGAVTQGEAGDNTHLVALIGAMSAERAAPAGSEISGTYTASELAAAFSTSVSSKAEIAEGTLAMRQARFHLTSTEEARAIGVDMDFELANLTTIENAYSANAQVMSVVNQLFQVLLEI